MSSNVIPLASPGTTRADVAAAVRAHLAVRQISDSALGRAIGMSQSMISRRTNGSTAFDTDDLGRIAGYLGLDLVELVQMPKGAPAPHDDSSNPRRLVPKVAGSIPVGGTHTKDRPAEGGPSLIPFPVRPHTAAADESSFVRIAPVTPIAGPQAS